MRKFIEVVILGRNLVAFACSKLYSYNQQFHSWVHTSPLVTAGFLKHAFATASTSTASICSSAVGKGTGIITVQDELVAERQPAMDTQSTE